MSQWVLGRNWEGGGVNKAESLAWALHKTYAILFLGGVTHLTPHALQRRVWLTCAGWCSSNVRSLSRFFGPCQRFPGHEKFKAKAKCLTATKLFIDSKKERCSLQCSGIRHCSLAREVSLYFETFAPYALLAWSWKFWQRLYIRKRPRGHKARWAHQKFISRVARSCSQQPSCTTALNLP